MNERAFVTNFVCFLFKSYMNSRLMFICQMISAHVYCEMSEKKHNRYRKH